MADNKRAARKAAKDLASGKAKPSSIGAKARAAANKLKSGKHAGPEKETGSGKPGRHAKMTGGRHAKSDAMSSHKNAYGSMDSPSVGKHSREAAMSRKVEASKPPKPQGQGIGSVKEAVTARKKVRGK